MDNREFGKQIKGKLCDMVFLGYNVYFSGENDTVLLMVLLGLLILAVIVLMHLLMQFLDRRRLKAFGRHFI